VNEIGQVIGTTPAIFARIQPFLSLYNTGDQRLLLEQSQRNGKTDSMLEMAQIINYDSVLAGFGSAANVVRITAEAMAPGGARHVRLPVARRPQLGSAAPAWAIREGR
jgi:hypothetical protein